MNDTTPIDPVAASPVADAPAAPPPSPAPRPSQAVRIQPGKIGVLLVNLGTPDACNAQAVRRYLEEFLTDPRVIENQGPVWQLVLNGIILPIRPRIKARAYQKIWNREQDELPLKTITRSQAEKLASTLEPLGAHVKVDWAMRYGNPSIASKVKGFVMQGCERILVLPLYPQYSAATTASVGDEVFHVLSSLRRQPALRIAAPYYDDLVYIEALAASTSAELSSSNFSRRWSSPRSTACRRNTWTRAIPITISACDCGACARAAQVR